MKIKAIPEDFRVKEIIDPFPLGKEGAFGLYLLTKKNRNTLDALKYISAKTGIPFSCFSYGGKKDRHALTSQHVSIRGRRHPVSVSEPDISFEFIGSTDDGMSPRAMKGNFFEITVRDFRGSEKERVSEAARHVREKGFPNYFDDQRFGSHESRQGFLAEKIIRKHHNGALKIFLTGIRPEDKSHVRERKTFFFDNWGKWEACRAEAATAFEQNAFEHLCRKGKDFVPLLQRIPREDMSLFFSAFQSHLWNEILRRVIRLKAKDRSCSCRGKTGEYVFYTDIPPGALEYLEGLSIATPASNAKMTDKEAEGIYSEILKENGLTPAMFNSRKIRQAYFKAVDRKAVIMPENFSFTFAKDDIYMNREKMLLKFFLPRGSYATMLIKRLFCSGG